MIRHDPRQARIHREDFLLRPKEAARLLGITDRCLRMWVKSGKLAAVRTPGGHYRYPLEAILGVLQRDGMGPCEEPSAALYARGLDRRQVRDQLKALRQAALEIGYRVRWEEYDLQRGHRLGVGLQRLLVMARARVFRVVLITSYSRLGWLGATDPRFFHLVFALLGVQLIALWPFEEAIEPGELLEDFCELHGALSEHLKGRARWANRRIQRALERIRREHLRAEA